MRIAWVTYDFEEYSASHVNEMAAEHDVLLVMPRPEEGEPTYEVNSAVEHFPFHKPRLRQPLRQWRSISEIVRKIKDFGPDVIHYQQGHLWFNSVLHRLRPVPLVVTIHDPRHHRGDAVSQKTPQWWMDYGFRQADEVLVHGAPLASQVQSLFGFGSERIHVVPHVAMGLRAAGESVSDGNTVLFFGRIWEYKGLETLIRCQPLVSRSMSDVRFVIAGEGEDFSRYRRLMDDPNRFEIHNRWIDDDERAEFFNQASLVVLPYHEATQSGVVPVAYSHGKPVVATDVGALSECVRHGDTGLLVPPRDPAALAEAITQLLGNPVLCERMGRAGREMVETELSPAAVAEKTVDVYRRAVANSRRRVSGRQLGFGATDRTTADITGAP